MIKYSVIIPVYNSSLTINRCLDSIVSQITNEIEIIIINDGSTDNSLKICENYANKYNNIKIITKENGGPSAARNRGIKIARGNYLIFVDADDYISEDYFKIIDKEMNNNLDLLKYNINYFGNRVDVNLFNTESFAAISGIDYLNKMIDDNKIFATPWMYVFKKDLFIKNNFFFSENHIHEDYGLIPCIIIKSKSIKGIDYNGYNYVYTEGSLSTSKDYSEIVRRSFDMLYQYDYLNNFSINIKDENMKTKFLKYIMCNLLKKRTLLKDKELIVFDKELQSRGITKYE